MHNASDAVIYHIITIDSNIRFWIFASVLILGRNFILKLFSMLIFSYYEEYLPGTHVFTRACRIADGSEKVGNFRMMEDGYLNIETLFTYYFSPFPPQDLHYLCAKIIKCTRHAFTAPRD